MDVKRARREGPIFTLSECPATTTWYLQRQGLTNLRLVGELDYRYQLAFLSRSDWPELNGILEAALATISDRQREQIARNWIALDPGAPSPGLYAMSAHQLVWLRKLAAEGRAVDWLSEFEPVERVAPTIYLYEFD